MDLQLHIFLNIIAFVLLGISISFSGLYVLQQKLLKEKKLNMIQKIPSLESSDHWAARFVVLGWITLLSSTFVGIYLAHEVWGSSWLYQPKILMAIVTCFWYFIFILMRLRFDYRGSKFSFINLLGFISFLSTFLYSLR
ncbi:MAG: cytochrome c biogenesis protein CcsA [Bdellovibrionales bacterium]|nr:cytochrome c biogenesis protein CcsA [Bdellovibrionales bacterium]